MIATREQNHSLRSFILKKVLEGETIQEAYERFCEEKGKNAMEYPEFDFWYYHFYNENHLDDDIDLAPKQRTFSDLPVEVVGKLIDRVNPVDRLALRKVSHFLQDVVNNNRTTFEDLSLEVYDGKSTITNKLITYFRKRCDWIDFKPVEGGCEAKYAIGNELIKGSNQLKTGINEFLWILKNPKFQFKALSLIFGVSTSTEEEDAMSKKFWSFFESELQTSNHQVHAEEVRFTTDHLESVLTILPYLKPGALKSIELRSSSSNENQLALEKLFSLDQWKQAVKTKGALNRTDTPISIEQVFQFTHFKGKIESLTNEDLIKIRNILLPTSKLEHYVLVVEKRIDKQEVANVFNANLGLGYQFRYTIPGTDKIIEFSVRLHCMKITTQLDEFDF